MSRVFLHLEEFWREYPGEWYGVLEGTSAISDVVLVEYPDIADIGLAVLETALLFCALVLCTDPGLFADAEGAEGGPCVGTAAAEAAEGG